MYNASQLNALFEHNPMTVAIGKQIAFANKQGDGLMVKWLLDDLDEAVARVMALEACFELDAA